MPTKPAKRPRTDHQHRIMLIKMGQAQLMWSDEKYHQQNYALTGKTSCTQMNDAEHARVIEHMLASGAVLRWNKRHSQKVTAEKAPLVAKIRVLLLHLGNRSDGYADGISRRMYKVDQFTWLDPRQLIGIVTALSKELERLRKRAEQAEVAA